ncbi:MAG TPA: S53 family peptidase [Frankiaceae bacterium]
MSRTPSRRLTRRLLALGAGTGATLLSIGVLAGPAGAAAAAPHSSHRVCGAPAPGYAACHAIMLDSSAATANALAPNAAPAGYGPADIQKAYALPGGTSITGPTVAIVDAYDDPTAAADLATYRSQYGLPACTVANGCFTKVGQTGTSSLPAKNASWAQEISLDLDMVSAACPTCKILLVETNSAAIGNLGAGVNTAVRLGAVAVSNSYGGAESSSDTGYDTSYYNHPGVAITVSSGDSGYGAQYPAASRYVTAVGGTTLTRSSSAARGFTESVWSGAGSGCSAYDAKPSWQKDTGCSRRTIADVAAVADPNTGVAVYDSTAYNGRSGWMVFGGTSAASPIVASVYAKAGTPSSGSYPASFPYAHPGALNDVTSGSNGSSSPAYLSTGGTGYDGPTGLGTPKGLTAFAG